MPIPIEDEEWFLETERSERNLMEVNFLRRLENQYLDAHRERLSCGFVEEVLSTAVRRHATEYFSTQAALAAVPYPESTIETKPAEAASSTAADSEPITVPAPPAGGSSSPRKPKSTEDSQKNARADPGPKGNSSNGDSIDTSESAHYKPVAAPLPPPPPPAPWSGTATPQEKLFYFLYRLLSAYPRGTGSPRAGALESAQDILSNSVELVFPVSTILDTAQELECRDGHSSPTVKTACSLLVELVKESSRQQRRSPTVGLGGSIVWGKANAQEAWVGGRPQAGRDQNGFLEAYPNPLGGGSGLGSVESVTEMFGSGRSSRSTTRCSSRADRNSPVQYRPPSASGGHPLQFDSSPSRSRPISPLSSMSASPYRAQDSLNNCTLSAEGLSAERAKLKKPTESYITARQVGAAFVAATAGIGNANFASITAKFLRMLLAAAPQVLDHQCSDGEVTFTTATRCRTATLKEAVQNLFTTLDLHGDRRIRLAYLRRLLSTIQSSGDVKGAALDERQFQHLYEEVLSAICNDSATTWGFSTVARWITDGFNIGEEGEKEVDSNLDQAICFCGLLIQSFWTLMALPQIGKLSTPRANGASSRVVVDSSYDPSTTSTAAGLGTGVAARTTKVGSMASMIYLEFLKKEATLLQTIRNVLKDIDEASLESLGAVWTFSLSANQNDLGKGITHSDIFQLPQLERFLRTANEWLGLTCTPQFHTSLTAALFSSFETSAGRRKFLELLRRGQHWWSGVPRSAAHRLLVGPLNGSLLWGETVVAKEKITQPELFRHWRFGLQCHVPLAAHSALFSLKHFVLAMAELATLRCGWNMKTAPRGTQSDGQKPMHTDPIPTTQNSQSSLSVSSSSIALPWYRPASLGAGSRSIELDESLWISDPSLSLDTIALLASHQNPIPPSGDGMDRKQELSLLRGIEVVQEEEKAPSKAATLPPVAEDDPAAEYWVGRRREQQQMLNALMKERDVFNENHVLSMERSAARALRPQTAPMQRKPQSSGERPSALLPTPPPGQRPQGPASPSSRR